MLSRRAGLSASAGHSCSCYSATVAAKLVYCSTAWSGFCSVADCRHKPTRCVPVVMQALRLLFSWLSQYICCAFLELFSYISCNVTHVLKQLLPTNTQHSWETDITTLYQSKKFTNSWTNILTNCMLLRCVLTTFITRILYCTYWTVLYYTPWTKSGSGIFIRSLLLGEIADKSGSQMHYLARDVAF